MGSEAQSPWSGSHNGMEYLGTMEQVVTLTSHVDQDPTLGLLGGHSQGFPLTWKNWSCLALLQKRGWASTCGAEGRACGTGLNMASTRSRATTLSGGQKEGWFRPTQPRALFLPPCWAQVSLTVGLLFQVSQTGSSCEDVGLAVKTVPKGVAATRKHIIEHTACREDVHSSGLGGQRDRNEEEEVTLAKSPQGLVQTTSPGHVLGCISWL